MHGLPNWAPRLVPDIGISLLNKDWNVLLHGRPNLQNGTPKRGFGNSSIGSPKRSVNILIGEI